MYNVCLKYYRCEMLGKVSIEIIDSECDCCGVVVKDTLGLVKKKKIKGKQSYKTNGTTPHVILAHFY